MDSQLPTRLYKLDGGVVRHAPESFDLVKNQLGKIIEGDELAKLKSCNYCAISHVWGDKPPSFPVIGIPWAVPISSREKLIFMLKACERRGYEYVWIDLLCVNQTKDDNEAKSEREGEVQNMKQYYKGAHATIVFGFNWRDFASQWTRVEARIKDWNGDWKKGINVHWDGFADIDTFINDDWFWRVWTLQETVIPLTTTPGPLGTEVTHPAPYNRARLLTSDGVPMDIRGLCDLIDWTYIALWRLDYTPAVGTYRWIHPGAGSVNEHDAWWTMAVVNDAIRLGATPLHPIQAMRLTQHRKTSRPSDRLKGVYALIDPVWHSTKPNPTPQELYRELADKYIDQGEGALLLTMAVSQETTWAAAAFPDSNFGSVVPRRGEYRLMSATVDGDTLSLRVAGLTNDVTICGTKDYGDGSGELRILFNDLYQLPSSYDTSSIVTLIKLAVDRSRVNLGDAIINSIEEIKSFIDFSLSNANAVSSALRAAFSGWNRWIFLINKTTVILGWLPSKSTKSEPKYSLLWMSHGIKNEWAVLVEEVDSNRKQYRKVGIAFVNSEPMNSEADVVIL